MFQVESNSDFENEFCKSFQDQRHHVPTVCIPNKAHRPPCRANTNSTVVISLCFCKQTCFFTNYCKINGTPSFLFTKFSKISYDKCTYPNDDFFLRKLKIKRVNSIWKSSLPKMLTPLPNFIPISTNTHQGFQIQMVTTHEDRYQTWYTVCQIRGRNI